MLENAKWFKEINELKENKKSEAKAFNKAFENYEFTKIYSDDGLTLLHDDAPVEKRITIDDIEMPMEIDALKDLKAVIEKLPLINIKTPSDINIKITYRFLPRLNAEVFFFYSKTDKIWTKEYVVPFGTLFNLTLDSISKRSIRSMAKESALNINVIKEDLAALQALLDFCMETKITINKELVRNILINTNFYKDDVFGSNLYRSMGYFEEYFKNSISYFAQSKSCDLGFILYHTLIASPLLGKNAILNKCSLCGKYFFPNYRSDQKYCYCNNTDYPTLTCANAVNKIRARDYKKKILCEKKYHQIANRLSQRTKNYHFEDFKNEYNSFKLSINSDIYKYHKTLDWLNKFEKTDKYASKQRSKDK